MSQDDKRCQHCGCPEYVMLQDGVPCCEVEYLKSVVGYPEVKAAGHLCHCPESVPAGLTVTHCKACKGVLP